MSKITRIAQAIFSDIPANTWSKHIALYMLTFLSTTLTGMTMTDMAGLAGLLTALSYSLPVMLILTAHELGHYIFARLYGVPVTLPYFIPMPFISPFGTMGAFIRMKGLPPDRRSLFDIAFWGPAMSFIFSIPFLIGGLWLSEVRRVPAEFSGLVFGDSLLIKIATFFIFDVPPGYEVYIHPMAFAAWAGLFVTAINLFPIGQLDGGHIAYAVFGKRQKEVGYLFLAILLLLSFEFTGWFLWVLILIFMGVVHPPLPSEYFHYLPLDQGRKRLALLSGLILLFCFVPNPIRHEAPVPHELPFQPDYHRERTPDDVQPDEYHLYIPNTSTNKSIGA